VRAVKDGLLRSAGRPDRASGLWPLACPVGAPPGAEAFLTTRFDSPFVIMTLSDERKDLIQIYDL